MGERRLLCEQTLSYDVQFRILESSLGEEKQGCFYQMMYSVGLATTVQQKPCPREEHS